MSKGFELPSNLTEMSDEELEELTARKRAWEAEQAAQEEASKTPGQKEDERKALEERRKAQNEKERQEILDELRGLQNNEFDDGDR